MPPKSGKRQKRLHPTGDERYKVVDRAMKRLKHEPDALLEVLNGFTRTQNLEVIHITLEL